MSSSKIAMAFQSSEKTIGCADCGIHKKFFKMFQSYRPDDFWRDDDGRSRATLYCMECELKKRQKEWHNWDEVERQWAGGEKYVTLEHVRRDVKNKSKEGWCKQSECIISARISMKALRTAEAEGKDEVTVSFAVCMERM